ncbi:carboxymuconolactone decarboxylase family protein [Actinokineospora bangkokensis]|uniref:4-carboxymuconolactone decarboxylase n=1 Tax=Actinokineospora bangkokensis TaxID=1193682 RepID=A0A1Q9LKH1_9PSEU|nr:carboxymuconolactone decarboxylase family protein [Actinokineospora bangkokensis]OLR92557.1 4-carboxymuconolactone decarboxylase [Actinokineospora bangkokensis]
MAPRIAQGGLRENRLLGWALPRLAGVVAGTAPMAVFGVLGRNRPVFRGWLHFSGKLLAGGRLGRRDTELVILRVAHLRGNDYEWQHHVHLSARVGFDAAHIDAVRRGPDAELWDDRQRALLRAVDRLHTDQDLDDDTWAGLRAHLDEPTALQFLFLAGHYQMLATVLTALRVEPDPPATGAAATAHRLLTRLRAR